jgi:hypothetical protein
VRQCLRYLAFTASSSRCITRSVRITIRIFTRFGEYRASFSIDPPALLAGAMPRRQQHLILAWAELHQEELLANWDRVAQEDALQRIKGLD